MAVDNILPEKDWLRKMVTPLLKTQKLLGLSAKQLMTRKIMHSTNFLIVIPILLMLLFTDTLLTQINFIGCIER